MRTSLKLIPLLLICFILFFIACIGLCVPEFYWEGVIDEAPFSYGYSVRETVDNGFIISSISRSDGGVDYVSLHKVTRTGELDWVKTIPEVIADHGVYIHPTVEGGYVLGSYTDNQKTAHQGISVIKTDATGEAEWIKSFPDLLSNHGVSLDQTIDGGYVFTGYMFSQEKNEEIVLVKLDSAGDEIWRKHFGGSGLDKGVSIQQMGDAGFIVAGITDPQGSELYDIVLVKTDSEGILVWNQTLGGDYVDYCMSVQQTKDQGFIVTGYSNSYGEGKFDVYLCKLGDEGAVQWEKTFGSSGSEKGMYGIETDTGSYVVSGYTNSFGNGLYDGYVLEVDLDGGLVWNMTFGGLGNDYGLFIQQSRDGGYIVTGLTESNTDESAGVYIGYYSAKEEVAGQSEIPGAPLFSIILGLTVFVNWLINEKKTNHSFIY